MIVLEDSNGHLDQDERPTQVAHYARPSGEFIATYYGGGEPEGEFVEIPEAPPINGSQKWLFPGWTEYVPAVVAETVEERLQRLMQEISELQREIGKS